MRTGSGAITPRRVDSDKGAGSVASATKVASGVVLVVGDVAVLAAVTGVKSSA